jgi:hypothetical protein
MAKSSPPTTLKCQYPDEPSAWEARRAVRTTRKVSGFLKNMSRGHGLHFSASGKGHAGKRMVTISVGKSEFYSPLVALRDAIRKSVAD